MWSIRCTLQIDLIDAKDGKLGVARQCRKVVDNSPTPAERDAAIRGGN